MVGQNLSEFFLLIRTFIIEVVGEKSRKTLLRHFREIVYGLIEKEKQRLIETKEYLQLIKAEAVYLLFCFSDINRSLMRQTT